MALIFYTKVQLICVINTVIRQFCLSSYSIWLQKPKLFFRTKHISVYQLFFTILSNCMFGYLLHSSLPIASWIRRLILHTSSLKAIRQNPTICIHILEETALSDFRKKELLQPSFVTLVHLITLSMILVIQFFPAFCCFIPLRSKFYPYFPS
jgi:hypothetical protein